MFDLEEFLSENYKEKFKFPLIASHAFKNMLADLAIDHGDEFAHKLIQKIKESPMSDFTMLDIDYTTENDVMSFVPSSKLKVDYYATNDEYEDHEMTVNTIEAKLKAGEYKSQPVGIGRMIKKIFGNEITDKELESFVNRWKSSFEEKQIEFKEYSGRNVCDAYSTDNYADDGGELGNSCMNDDTYYLSIYRENPGVVSVLVLLDKNELIRGRALLWTDNKGRRLLDRIYTIDSFDIDTFKKYAFNKGYYVRNKNNSSQYDGYFKNKEGEVLGDTRIILNKPISQYDYYPYMDTFKWGVYKSLYNTEPYDDGDDDIYFMESTDGDAEITSHKVDARGNEISHRDYQSGYYEYSSLEGGLVDTDADDVVELNYSINGRLIKDYAYDDNKEIEYCPIDDKWYMKNHMEWSNFNNCYIFRGSATHVLDENGISDLVHDDTLYDWWDAHPTLDPRRRKKNESAVIDNQEIKAEDYGVSAEEIESKKSIIKKILKKSGLNYEDKIIGQITVSTLLTIKWEGDVEMKKVIRDGLEELKLSGVGNNIVKELVRIVKSGDYNQVIQIDDGREHRRPQAKVKRFSEFAGEIINEDK